MAEQPYILSTDPVEIQKGWVTAFETALGRPLMPAQVEYLLANAGAYREVLAREAFRDAALQNLVEFSRAPILDFLGDLVGVTRLAATAATCTLEFTCVAGHVGVVIPAGTSVRTTDGGAVFETDSELVIAAGVLTSTITATATVDGPSGNGYIAGTVTGLQTPILNVVSVTNTNTSGGGAATETDERLRERIKLAPAQFSNAGSVAAYRFFALSAHPDITDVSIPVIPQPAGTVNIYVLTPANPTPAGVIQAVEDACNAERVRPLTDTVNVQGVTRVTYACIVNITTLQSYVASEVQARVLAALTALLDEAKTTIGKDVTVTQIIGAAMVEGVYAVTIPAPNADVIVTQSQVAQYTAITVNISGSNVG